MTNSSMKVAVLGLGRMGAAVARRLATRGHAVTAWNRTGRAAPDGVRLATDPASALAGGDAVVLCLFDHGACLDVLEQVRDGLSGVAVVNTATVAPHEADDLAALVTAAGGRYLHAPVVGSVPAVEAGDLTVLAGGEHGAAARTVVADLGEVVELDSVAAAAAAKLAANAALGGALLAVRDARARAGELGLEDRQAWSLLERTPLGALVRAKRRRLDDGAFDRADFTVAALAKDARLLAGSAPGGRTLAARLDRMLAAGVAAPEDDVARVAVPPVRRGAPYGLAVDAAVDAPPDVLEPLVAYVAGHATGDPSHHREAFLPTAHVEGLRDGAFTSWTVDEYCALFPGRPADDEAGRRRRVDSVEVTGTVATAAMTLWHGPAMFTDMFVLLHVDGRWRIANKVYHRG